MSIAHGNWRRFDVLAWRPGREDSSHTSSPSESGDGPPESGGGAHRLNPVALAWGMWPYTRMSDANRSVPADVGMPRGSGGCWVTMRQVDLRIYGQLAVIEETGQIDILFRYRV